ncbi:type VI secretion system lipoprotein TssJ [Telmatospirillum sp.]|uniref:type VI secretion system lipoprotein TssJ n=1 Tax=Telmatospirillum sp. TaxID=2079197 RepID=UPI00284A4323|nr:type VI secretion system lipoprotein TssJ [Telmatospirillum sp.]MDR3435265.1 type VI secretion system lipoprotein TssJ [Telmatospirillum sp.]
MTLSVCGLVTGCSLGRDDDGPHHQAIPVSLSAAANVNPYPDGQPAPIVTRVYQLAAKDKFVVADPMQLILHDAQTLGDDEIGRDEFILQPGDKHQMTIPANDKVHFVGVVAAYRAIDKDDWREFVVVPDDKGISLDVTIGATGLQVTNSAAR